MNYQILKNIVEEYIEIFKNVSDDDWNYKPFENKWSKKEILGHLVDSALTNIRRFIVIQYNENENIVYEQDFWVKAQNYQKIPISEIIQLWKILNLQIVNVVENIPDEALQNLCDTTKTQHQVFTLEYIINDYINHMNYHLKSI